ncbi:hypothetical protein [Streptomyces sp. T028]|uniref:hypothetical protein n=1 Tax=Streptomyces sp. T028 TaxID=3394379 RepID=UPI003A8A550F
MRDPLLPCENLADFEAVPDRALRSTGAFKAADTSTAAADPCGAYLAVRAAVEPGAARATTVV